MNIPGFTAEAALYRSTKSYKVIKNGVHPGMAIQLAVYIGPKIEPFLPVGGGWPTFDPSCPCPDRGANWKLTSSAYEPEIKWCWCAYYNMKTGAGEIKWVRPKK